MTRTINRLGIRAKVIAAFAAVLLCAVGQGWFALHGADRLHATASVLARKEIPAAQALGRVAQLAERLRSYQKEELLTTTPAAHATRAEKTAQVRTQLEKALDAYRPLVGKGGEEERLARALNTAWKDYATASTHFATLADLDEARTYLLPGMHTVADAFRDSIDAALAFQVAEGRQAAKDAESDANSITSGIATALGVTILLCIGAGLLIGRGIAGPVRALTEAMRRLARQELDTPIPGTSRGDEMGAMAHAVQVFKDGLIRAARLAAEQAEERQRAEAEKVSALTQMANTIEAETAAALAEVGKRVTAMADTASEMQVSAARTGASAQSAAAAASETMTVTQTVASAAEQLSASIREISHQVAQSTLIVTQAVKAGDDTRATMEALNGKVERIGAVADMITEIAAKTNLLALNATIEASRAGDAGRGFAVVASEVKQLAVQTAKSTEEISSQLGEIREETGAAMAAVRSIEQIIREVEGIAGSIAAAVKQQGAATAEIARNVTSAAGAANAMSGRASEVSQEAAKTDRSAASVRENTGALSSAMLQFRQSVIRAVRTSASEANRRLDSRHEAGMRGRLALPGQADVPVQVADISVGGARLLNGPSMPVGAKAILSLDGVGAPLPCRVLECNGTATHLRFDLDQGASGMLR